MSLQLHTEGMDEGCGVHSVDWSPGRKDYTLRQEQEERSSGERGGNLIGAGGVGARLESSLELAKSARGGRHPFVVPSRRFLHRTGLPLGHPQGRSTAVALSVAVPSLVGAP